MKAVLMFNLSREEDRVAHIAALKGFDYWSALWDLQSKIRAKVKYSKDPTTTWEEVQSMFYETLGENDVDLEEIQ